MLSKVLEESGLTCQHLNVDLSNIHEQVMPALVMMGSRLAVLIRVSKKKEYILHEPG